MTAKNLLGFSGAKSKSEVKKQRRKSHPYIPVLKQLIHGAYLSMAAWISTLLFPDTAGTTNSGFHAAAFGSILCVNKGQNQDLSKFLCLFLILLRWSFNKNLWMEIQAKSNTSKEKEKENPRH